jgi:ketosteroid isomerase-like protein
MNSFNKLLLFVWLLLGTLTSSSQSAKEKAIAAITKAENEFSAMASEKGIQAAFEYFAAPDVIIKRANDSLIKGKEGIHQFYSKDVFKKATLSWSPDFVDAAESGDLGYTFGKYNWQLKDEQGKIVQDSKGVFHTVWKKQPDGSWRFVWD